MQKDSLQEQNSGSFFNSDVQKHVKINITDQKRSQRGLKKTVSDGWTCPQRAGRPSAARSSPTDRERHPQELGVTARSPTRRGPAARYRHGDGRPPKRTRDELSDSAARGRGAGGGPAGRVDRGAEVKEDKEGERMGGGSSVIRGSPANGCPGTARHK